MAFPTAVNDQITDAITQSNIKVIGEAPGLAMGSLYQNIANTISALAHNAITAQEAQNIIAQSAVYQGVLKIYSIDDALAAEAVSTAKIAQTGVADNLTSLLSVLNAFKSAGPEAGAIAETPAAGEAVQDIANELSNQIEAAVKFSNDAVLGNVDAFMSGLRSAVDATAHAIDSMNRVAHDNLVRILQQASLANALAAMIREPQKAAEYEAVLQAIRRME